MNYPLKRTEWKQIILLSSPFILILTAVILHICGLVELPRWAVHSLEFLFYGAIMITLIHLLVVNGFPTKKYYIKKRPGLDIDELLNEYGYTHDVDAKEGWTRFREKGKSDFWAGRVSVQDVGNQLIVLAGKSSGLKRKLKEMSYLDEIYFF